MYNLLIGYSHNEAIIPGGRLFERTDSRVRDSLGEDYTSSIAKLPVLIMPEIGDDRFEQVARVGTVTAGTKLRGEYSFTFRPNPNIDPIPSTMIQDLADDLGIESSRFAFTRTHWAVKDVDLFQILMEHQSQTRRGGPGELPSSGTVQFPIDTPRDPNLVAVMMPFDRTFDVVYETIQAAASDVGLATERADNIWENDHVMGDVLSLLWKARIVVADLTGENPNVFYEVGLAHALPRRTILLKQADAKVPFDLLTVRHLKYGIGTNERAQLRHELSQRITTLIQQPGS